MTAKIKLNAASGGGSVSIQAPALSSNNRVYNLPDTAHISTLGGISEFDQWHLTADVTSNGDITSNLSRVSTAGSASPLGSGMSISSGVFSFSSTGKYLIIVCGHFTIANLDNVYIGTNVTLNNGGAYSAVVYAGDGNTGSGSADGNGTSFYFLDVTDTGQVKVKFDVVSITGSTLVKGSASELRTHFTFLRIGDT